LPGHGGAHHAGPAGAQNDYVEIHANNYRLR
jgi:hypothetical protein